MRISLSFLWMLLCGIAQAQSLLKTGDLFPNMIIRPIVNAPVKALDVHTPNKKFLILNFWGTWCSPCIPEMDSLARLQAKNSAYIQVIGISNDPVSRLQKYLQRKPSSLWLVSDTTSNLYQQFGFNSVGQAAIIDQQHRIIALVNTDSINQSLIDKLVRKEAISSSAETGNIRNYGETDPFAVDSAIGFQVTWSGYRPGAVGMTKSYLKTSLEGRRRTYFNSCLTDMLMDAYAVSYRQVIFEVPKNQVCNSDDKHTLYCFDLLVKPEQKDSFYIIMRQLLNKFLPVKVRLEKKEMPVYVLRQSPDSAPWQESSATDSGYGFSGNGFEGKRIGMKSFVDYVANELGLPVVDETGLTGKYDIVTHNEMRTHEDMLAALKKIGLSVEKTTRLMDAVIVY